LFQIARFLIVAAVEMQAVAVGWQVYDITKRAEYSVDAGDWNYVEPVGQLSDAKTENYDFKIAPEREKDGSATSAHVVVVRVYDRYENMGAAKALIRVK